MKFGYHCSQEQYSPRETLEHARQAERAGFRTIMTSDHFNPWSARQGHSGHTWTRLGAALQVTESASFGSLAIPGGWRYHPAMLAQSIATLCDLAPDRLDWIAVGSGQALSEHVVGEKWPAKAERNARAKRGVEIMRALWRGETVSDVDGIIPIKTAKLWSLPRKTPQIYGCALSPETAAFLAPWVDGLVTIGLDTKVLTEVLKAFRSEGGRDKPALIQLHLSWNASEEIARVAAFEQWRSNAFPPKITETWEDPAAFDEAAQKIRPEDMDDFVFISSKLRDHQDWL